VRNPLLHLGYPDSVSRDSAAATAVAVVAANMAAVAGAVRVGSAAVVAGAGVSAGIVVVVELVMLAAVLVVVVKDVVVVVGVGVDERGLGAGVVGRAGVKKVSVLVVGPWKVGAEMAVRIVD